MSTASSATPAAGSIRGGPARTGDLLAGLTRPDTLIATALLGLGFILLFQNWLLAQHEHSWGNGDWSHAYLVPLISGYLLWQNRHALERAPLHTFWPGLAPLIMGVWSYVYFIAGVPNHLGQGLAMILTLFGLLLLLLGPGAMRALFLPVAYLVFAVTLPEKVMNELTFKLQQVAATGSWIVLNAVGVRTDIAGNVLNVLKPDMTVHPLNVAEQCSGMRMVIAFLALGVAVALVGVRTWWKRVVLVALAVPVAVLLNVLRVVVLGVAALFDSNLATGEAHTFIGTVLLVPGFLLYMLVLVALNKAVPEPAPDAPEASEAPAPGSSSGARSFPAGGAA